MVSVDNLGRKLCGILQSKSFRGNDVEFKYSVTGYQNSGSVKKKKTDYDVNVMWNFYVVLPLYFKFFCSRFS